MANAFAQLLIQFQSALENNKLTGSLKQSNDRNSQLQNQLAGKLQQTTPSKKLTSEDLRDI